MHILSIIINPLLATALSPLMVGIIRKMKAYMQNRHGASVFQPYFDMVKLFHKDEVISEDASWIFRTAPYIVFGTTLAIAAGIPILSELFVFAPMSDILVFVYTLAAGTFFLALSGIDVGGGFGGFGASREMMVAAMVEGGLVMSLFAVTLLSGTTNLGAVHAALQGTHSLQLLPLMLAAGAFFIALLAENARFPFDNPATHLELTMIHEAMILEYSGKRLALMEWAAANKLFIFTAVFVNVFFPFGVDATLSPASLAASLVIFLVKMTLVAGAIALIESIMAKFRVFRLPDLLFASYVIAIIAISLMVL